jgi:hypothetical protein
LIVKILEFFENAFIFAPSLNRKLSTMNKTDTNKDNKTLDLDAYWKALMTEFLPEGVAMMHPVLHDAVDWTIPPVFLEQELINALKGRFKIKDKRKFTDKLAKLCLKSGKEHYLFLHAEAQHEPEDDFNKRMYVYRSLIYLCYDIEDITALAVFTGAPPDPKSLDYYHKCFGTELIYRYISYIIATQNEKKLLASENPFAIAVLAALYTHQTVNDAERRFAFKRKVFELAQKKNIPFERMTKLLNFVKDFMHLPEPLEREFEVENYSKFLNPNNPMVTVYREGTAKLISQFIYDMTGKTVEEYKADFAKIDAERKKHRAVQRELQAKNKIADLKRKKAEAKSKEAEAKSKEAEAKSKEAEAKGKEAEAKRRIAEAKLVQIQEETIFNLYSKIGLSIDKIASTLNLEVSYVQKIITENLGIQ